MKSEFTNNEKMGLQEVPEQERAYESELAVVEKLIRNWINHCKKRKIRERRWMK